MTALMLGRGATRASKGPLSPRARTTLTAGLLLAATFFGHSAHAASNLEPCRDGAYTLTPSVWKTTYRWQFWARSTPSGVSTAAAARAF